MELRSEAHSAGRGLISRRSTVLWAGVLLGRTEVADLLDLRLPFRTIDRRAGSLEVAGSPVWPGQASPALATTLNQNRGSKGLGSVHSDPQPAGPRFQSWGAPPQLWPTSWLVPMALCPLLPVLPQPASWDEVFGYYRTISPDQARWDAFLVVLFHMDFLCAFGLDTEGTLQKVSIQTKRDSSLNSG